MRPGQVDDSRRAIQGGVEPGGLVSQVQDPVLHSRVGRPARHEVDGHHATSQRISGQQIHDPPAKRSRRSGDDYRAHRPTMPV